MQFRQMPRLQDGERTLFQSQAILRYLARPNGLCGEIEDERVRCDISVEAGRDLQQRLWDHFWSPGSNTPEAAAAFEAGPLAEQLGLVAGWLGDAPFFGGERLLFADYYVLTVLDEAAAFFPSAMARVRDAGRLPAADVRAAGARRLRRLRPPADRLRLRPDPQHAHAGEGRLSNRSREKCRAGPAGGVLSGVQRRPAHDRPNPHPRRPRPRGEPALA